MKNGTIEAIKLNEQYNNVEKHIQQEFIAHVLFAYPHTIAPHGKMGVLGIVVALSAAECEECIVWLSSRAAE